MIGVLGEFPSVEVHVKFGYAKNYGKSLLFDLTVILFCRTEGP